MKILKFLDKLFDVTAKVESTIETVSKRTRLTIEKIVRDVTRNMFNFMIILFSLCLVVSGLIILLSQYIPLEYALLFFGLLGFVYILLQKVTLQIR